MKNIYQKLLNDVLLLELPLLRIPQKKIRKKPFRWIIVDSYSKPYRSGIYHHTITRLWER